MLQEIYAHREDPDWLRSQHFGLGMGVRNTLRAGGFGWDDLTLDAEWPGLIMAVVERAEKGT